MLKITYYIFRQLSLATLFVTIILTSAVWLTQSLRFIDGVMNKGLPLSTFFYVVIFLLPDLISIVLPGALLVSILYTYNKLIADQEISVMRSAGMSDWQLAKPAIILAMLVTIILYSVNLYFIPNAFRNLRDLEHRIRNTVSAAMLQEGEFHTLKGLTVYIRSRSNPKDMRGILIYNKRDPENPFLVTAEAGSIVETPEGMRLILINGTRQDIDKKTNAPSNLYFDQYTVDLTSPNDAATDRTKKPQEYDLSELLFPTSEVTHESNFSRFKAHGHMRILNPLYAIAYSLIGLAIMLYGEINRRRRTDRILMITAAACLLQFSTLGLVNISEKLFFAIPMTYLVFLLAAGFAFGQLKEWRKTSRIVRINT